MCYVLRQRGLVQYSGVIDPAEVERVNIRPPTHVLINNNPLGEVTAAIHRKIVFGERSHRSSSLGPGTRRCKGYLRLGCAMGPHGGKIKLFPPPHLQEWDRVGKGVDHVHSPL